MAYDNKIFYPASFGPACLLDAGSGKILWKKDVGILWGNVMKQRDDYFGIGVTDFNETFSKYLGWVVCIDGKTGDIVWKGEKSSFGCSLIAADGLLFVRSYKSLMLVDATRDGYKVLGKMDNMFEADGKFFDGPSIMGFVMPVLSNGRLFVRLPGELLCLDVKNK